VNDFIAIFLGNSSLQIQKEIKLRYICVYTQKINKYIYYIYMVNRIEYSLPL
jgi:hypothetical protein